VSDIANRSAGSVRLPPVLEGDQAGVARILTIQIKLTRLTPFCFLNRLPKQELHSPKIVEPLVGASILIDERILEGKGKARDLQFGASP
jgi:hypothetical protein